MGSSVLDCFAVGSPHPYLPIPSAIGCSTAPAKISTLLFNTGCLADPGAVGGAIGVLFSRSRKRTAYLFSLATLVAIAVFAALEVPWSDLYCWAFLPTERDAEQAIRQAITERNQPISLVSLHKTDGQESVIDGVKHYRLEYDAEWEITKDCDWKDARWYGWDVAEEYRRGRASRPTPNEQAKKGDRVRTFGRIGFQKTKEGWRPRGECRLLCWLILFPLGCGLAVLSFTQHVEEGLGDVPQSVVIFSVAGEIRRFFQKRLEK